VQNIFSETRWAMDKVVEKIILFHRLSAQLRRVGNFIYKVRTERMLKELEK
jgi:hypothetical protein